MVLILFWVLRIPTLSALLLYFLFLCFLLLSSRFFLALLELDMAFTHGQAAALVAWHGMHAAAAAAVLHALSPMGLYSLLYLDGTLCLSWHGGLCHGGRT